MTTTLDRGDFWEFKARCAELDLEMAKTRTAWEAFNAQKQALVERLAKAHGLDPARPLILDDVALTVTQGEG